MDIFNCKENNQQLPVIFIDEYVYLNIFGLVSHQFDSWFFFMHAGFHVSVIHQTLTWTTGSLTCVHHSYACAYTWGLGTPTMSQHTILDSGKTLSFSCATDGVRTSGHRMLRPTLYQLSHPVTQQILNSFSLRYKKICITIRYCRKTLLPLSTDSIQFKDFISLLFIKHYIDFKSGNVPFYFYTVYILPIWFLFAGTLFVLK